MIAHRQLRAVLKRSVATLLTMGSYNRDALTMNPIASTPAGNTTHWILNRDANALGVGPGGTVSVRAAHDAQGMSLAGILVMHR
jgi:hypothetical protein